MSATQKLLRFGVFELNLDAEELSKSGVVVKLPPQPFKLLVLLASHAGQIVVRDEIQQQLWVGETFVDFEHGVNKCINQIRTVLGDDADRPIYVQTLPRRGYRFVAPVVSKTVPAPQPKVIESYPGETSRLPVLIGGRMGAATAEVAVASLPAAEPATDFTPTQKTRVRWSRVRLAWIGVAVLVVAAGGGLYWRWRAHKATRLTEKDTIVLADFDNKTGDPVFDNTLKQGLAIQLEQSPFLNLISQEIPRKAGLFRIFQPQCDRTSLQLRLRGGGRSHVRTLLWGKFPGNSEKYREFFQICGVAITDVRL